MDEEVVNDCVSRGVVVEASFDIFPRYLAMEDVGRFTIG